MIHLGLNDLHLALGMKFMFELLADGTVDRLAKRSNQREFHLDLVESPHWKEDCFPVLRY